MTRQPADPSAPQIAAPGMEATVARFRVLLVLAAFLYPGWAYIQLVEQPDSDPGLEGRFAVALACATLLGLTFASRFVRRNIETICLPLAMVIAAHNAHVVAINHLDIAYSLGFVLAMVGTAGAFESRWATLVFMTWATALSFLPDGDGPHLKKSFFVASVVTGMAMLYFSTRDRLALFAALKRANAALAGSRNLLADAQKVALVGGFRVVAGAEEFWWTDETYAIHDLLPGTPVTSSLTNPLYSAASLATLHEVMGAAFLDGRPFEIEGDVTTPKGRAVRVRVKGRPEFAGGQIKAVVGSIQDITEQHLLRVGLMERESSLRAQQQLLSQVLDHMPHGIYAKDAAADFRYVIWNRSMERLSGRDRAEVLGRTDRELLETREAERQRRLDTYVLNDGAPLDVPEEEVKPGDRAFAAHTVRVPIASPSGDTRMVLGVVEDITEVKQREELIRAQQAQLMHASKMSTLGEMSGGVAHEINNPLTVIMGFAQRLNGLAGNQTADWAEIQRCAERITAMTERIARIIRGLRTFAREASADPFEKTPLSRIFADTLELCHQRFLSRGVEIVLPEATPDMTIECRSVQVSQVLLNLLNNAYDAVQTRSEKWVRLTVEDLGDAVRIAVTDAGDGIPADVAAKMLHPFFTTKGVGEGTGLGLSISRGIVESHGGRLFLDTGSDHTRFVVELPKRQPTRRAA